MSRDHEYPLSEVDYKKAVPYQYLKGLSQVFVSSQWGLMLAVVVAGVASLESRVKLAMHVQESTHAPLHPVVDTLWEPRS
jgi:hypothetical protein